MISKLVGKLENRALSKALKEGNLRCPHCGEPWTEGVTDTSRLLLCPACGAEDVAGEWIVRADGAPRGWADRPPADNRIRREEKTDGSLVWYIPAGGTFGGFLLFGLFWTAITAVVSGGFTFAFLFGTPGEDADKVPPWVLFPILIVFFGIFWVIGLGMLFIAARNKWEQIRLRVTGDEVILSRKLFGWLRHKRIRRDAVREVSAEEFYRSNERPVYGVRIGSGKAKLKFGTMLRNDEKGWIAADLRRVLLGEQPVRRAPAATTATGETLPRQPSSRAFSVVLPTARKHLWPMAVLLTIIGLVFIGVGIFLIDGKGSTSPANDDPAFVRVFDFVFDLLTQGFRTIWLLASTAMAGGGIWLWAHLFRSRRIERRLEGDSTTVALRKYRRGLVLSEQTWPRGDIKAVRSTSSGHSNGKPMKKISLLAGEKEITLAWWVDADAADAVVDQATAALWQP